MPLQRSDDATAARRCRPEESDVLVDDVPVIRVSAQDKPATRASVDVAVERKQLNLTGGCAGAVRARTRCSKAGCGVAQSTSASHATGHCGAGKDDSRAGHNSQ